MPASSPQWGWGGAHNASHAVVKQELFPSANYTGITYNVKFDQSVPQHYLHSHGYCQVVVLPNITYTKINWTSSFQSETDFQVFVSDAHSSSVCGIPAMALSGDAIVSKGCS